MAKQAQKEQAAARRAAARDLARKVGKMSEAEKMQICSNGLPTVEGRALSWHNSILVMLQKPGASLVGGFKQWKAAGRIVNRGEHGAAIWYPVGLKKEENGASNGNGAGADETRFFLGTVFDVSQTSEIQ